MYYEVHGSGGTPLLLLHGGLFNIDLQFGELLPSLAAGRQVIAADFQGHGVLTTLTDRSPPPAWRPTSSACCSTCRWRKLTSSGSASAAASLFTSRYGIPSWSAS
jgi:pimeloyl-ACP methyl ester carboxylesterase